MVGLKEKKQVFAELLLVRGFIRPIASGGSQNFTLYDPIRKQNSPSLFVKFRHYKVVITICYWMIISVSKKKFFNSIWPVLKSISLREIIAFLHSFVSVRYLTIFILFCFALFSHFTLWILGWGRGVRGLQSTHNISVNAFARGKSIFVCRRCELINT